MDILIIGNGFDLAHGLPTKYTDFLKFIGVIQQVIAIKNKNGLNNITLNDDVLLDGSNNVFHCS